MAKQVTDPDNSVEQQSLRCCKPYLSFSIDNILGRDAENARCETPAQKETYVRRESTECKTPSVDPIDPESVANLPWLSYTRYSPPKLPSE